MFRNKIKKFKKSLKKEFANDYKAKYIGLESYNRTEEEIIDILYGYVVKNNLNVKILRESNFISELYDCDSYRWKLNLDNIRKDLGEFKKLLLSTTEPQNADLLKCIGNSIYSYNFLINVVFPNVDKLRYITSMVEYYAFRDEQQVLNLLKKNILFSRVPYVKKYDYDKLYTLVNNLFEGDFKEFYYYLDYPALKSLVDADRYSNDDISEILKFCSLNRHYTLQNELIPSLVKAGFKKDELFEFLPIVLHMQDNDIMVKKIKIFLHSSSKEELFKKIFEISKV